MFNNYPAQPEDLNLGTMHQMKKKFKCEIGFSDHTLGIGSSLAAISLGASVIEKHFTLDKKIKTVDSFFSLEPKEMKLLVENSKIAWQSLGKISYSLSKGELNSKKFKRSLYFIKKMKKNETISHLHIRAIRPGFGLPTKYYNQLIGKKGKNERKKRNCCKSRSRKIITLHKIRYFLKILNFKKYYYPQKKSFFLKQYYLLQLQNLTLFGLRTPFRLQKSLEDLFSQEFFYNDLN